jgi:predicted nucleic acid-binding protein
LPETLVVDCSVAAKWVLPEPGDVEALRLLEEEQSGEISLIAPDLLLAEFASLAARKVRRKQISAEQAREGFRFIEESVPRWFKTVPLLEGALDLALNNQMSLWDSVYLALALEHRCPLITADRRLFRGHSLRHPAIRLLKTGNH